MADYEEWDSQEALMEAKRRRRERARRNEERRRKRIISLISKMVALVLSVVAIGLIIHRTMGPDKTKQVMNQNNVAKENAAQTVSTDEQTQGAEAADLTQVPQDAVVRIGSVGDVIMHLPIVKVYGGLSTSAAHDFKPALETFRGAYEAVDYMVANLETSFAGGNKAYSGFPNFNAPDDIALNLKEMGVDLELLANNHMYDNGKEGLQNTLSVLNRYGVGYTGARNSEQEPRYRMEDINGIRFGFINYTYEMEYSGQSKSINGNLMDASVENLLNTFELSDLDSFYKELGQEIQMMRQSGAEFVIAYLHWGNEYELEANDKQKEIAAKLCDMGVDAIIGGHPHVVQPMEVLTSTDGTHKMFCAYSLGNHFSNQRREQISSRPNGHTEDGLLLNLTITRSAGQTAITNIEPVATYVYKNKSSKYFVIPIYDPQTVESQTGISGVQSAAQASYERTWKILGNTVQDAKRELGIPVE